MFCYLRGIVVSSENFLPEISKLPTLTSRIVAYMNELQQLFSSYWGDIGCSLLCWLVDVVLLVTCRSAVGDRACPVTTLYLVMKFYCMLILVYVWSLKTWHFIFVCNSPVSLIDFKNSFCRNGYSTKQVWTVHFTLTMSPLGTLPGKTKNSRLLCAVCSVNPVVPNICRKSFNVCFLYFFQYVCTFLAVFWHNTFYIRTVFLWKFFL